MLKKLFKWSARLESSSGMTLMELMVSVAVVGVLAAMVVPWMSCVFTKTRMASVLQDMSSAQAQVEQFEAEYGIFPITLDEAYRGQRPPRTLKYCIEDDDSNRGHGNNYCTFFDSDNPSGQNEHGGTPGIGYRLWTNDNLANCAGVRVAWMTCCGAPPTLVGPDEEWDESPHPGDPQGGGGGN
jgi:prepilin-type N-terminal cleavage/methylation domain-containing protein